MTKDKFWQALVDNRPALQNPDATVTFTAENLRKLLDQAYDHGVWEAGCKQLFNSLFGGIG